MPLADPLMSLVDTICIGQVSGTMDLAALAPTSLVFAFASNIFTGLSVATVSLVGDACREGNTSAANSVLATAMTTAVALGLASQLALQIWGPQLIAATGCEASLLQPAWSYMRVRAWAMPSVLVLMVAQAALLAQQDAITPLVAVATQCALNIGGDWLLVVRNGGGLAGAAWATVASQIAGTLVMLIALQRSSKVKLSRELPSWADIQGLARIFGPASFTYFCKNLCYLMMQKSATVLPAASMAAHQAVYGLWSLISFTSVPTEQAALSFVPQSKPGSQARKETMAVIMCMALALGAVMGPLAGLLPALAPGAFTSDPALWPLMRSVALQSLAATVLCMVDVAAGGLLVANGQMRVLVRAMGITLGATAAYFTLTGLNNMNSLGSVWWGLVYFFVFRLAQSCRALVALFA